MALQGVYIKHVGIGIKNVLWIRQNKKITILASNGVAWTYGFIPYEVYANLFSLGT